MSTARLQFLLDLEDRVSPGMQKVQTGLDNFKGKVEKMAPAFKQMAVVGTAGFAAVTGAVALSVKESMANEAAQNRLAHILKTSRGATDEQVAALIRQAGALEKVGVVAGESIVQGMAQLATFDLSTDAIEKLTPAILDYVVAEKGASASTEDLKGLTNGLAQALQGNFASLTKTGFVLDEATKELIANGTEAERTAALVDVLNSTYEGFNASARETAEGSLVAMKNELNNVRSAIGDQFLPMITKLATTIAPLAVRLTEWIEKNPVLARNILIVSGALFALVAVAGTIGLILPAIITGFAALGTVLGFVGSAFMILLGPVGLVILAIAAVIAIGVLLYKNWEKIAEFASSVWEGIKETISGAMSRISEIFTNIWEGIKVAFWGYINFIIGAVAMLLDWIVPGWDTALMNMWNRAVEIWESIKAFFTDVFTAIGGGIESALTTISEVWSTMWEGMKGVFVSIWESISTIFDSVVEGISSAMESLVKPIQRVIDLAERALALAGGAIKSGAGKVSSFVKDIISRGSSITGKAIGGPVLAGTPYIVGENGPELFMPGQSGAIAPNGRFGGGGITINITGNTLLDRDAARKIGDEMVRYLKANVRI
jgi:hypothetical protein